MQRQLLAGMHDANKKEQDYAADTIDILDEVSNQINLTWRNPAKLSDLFCLPIAGEHAIKLLEDFSEDCHVTSDAGNSFSFNDSKTHSTSLS